MPHNRTPQPGSKYYLPKNEYLAVCNSCLCYEGWKMRVEVINATIARYKLDGATVSAMNYDGMPHGNATSDPTANEAIRVEDKIATLRAERDRIAKKIRIIENTVKEECGPVLYPYIMQGITQGVPLWKLQQDGFPMSQKPYSQLRRKVYFEIATQM